MVFPTIYIFYFLIMSDSNENIFFTNEVNRSSILSTWVGVYRWVLSAQRSALMSYPGKGLVVRLSGIILLTILSLQQLNSNWHISASVEELITHWSNHPDTTQPSTVCVAQPQRTDAAATHTHKYYQAFSNQSQFITFQNQNK